MPVRHFIKHMCLLQVSVTVSFFVSLTFKLKILNSIFFLTCYKNNGVYRIIILSINNSVFVSSIRFHTKYIHVLLLAGLQTLNFVKRSKLYSVSTKKHSKVWLLHVYPFFVLIWSYKIFIKCYNCVIIKSNSYAIRV